MSKLVACTVHIIVMCDIYVIHKGAVGRDGKGGVYIRVVSTVKTEHVHLVVCKTEMIVSEQHDWFLVCKNEQCKDVRRCLTECK